MMALGSKVAACSLYLLAFAAVLVPALSWAEQAAVRAHGRTELNIGQGFLTRYGEQCLVLLPTHVVTEAGGVASLLGLSRQARLGESAHFVDLGDDLSVGFVSGGLTAACGQSSATLSRAVDTHVRRSGLATLRWINPDGSQANVAMSVLDHGEATFMRVQPANEGDQFRKGQSGSLLIANERPVGLLLSVSSRSGRGLVIRMDAMLARLDRYMRERHVSTTTAVASAGSKARRDVAAAALGGKIIDWSVPSESAQSRAVHLLDTDPATHWRVAVARWPVSVSLALSGGHKQAIEEIVFAARDGEDEGTRPAQVTVMINNSTDNRRWRSLMSKPLDFDAQGEAVLRFSATWARELRFEFFGGATQTQLALSAVRVYSRD